MSKLEVDTIDTKTGTNSLTIKQNDTAAITIDTSQNVGIGTTTPSTGYGGTISNVKLALRNDGSGGNNGTSTLLMGGDNNHYSYLSAEHIGGGSTYLAFGTASGATNPTERCRIDSSGDILMNTTSAVGAEKLSVHFDRGSEWGIAIKNTSATSPNNATLMQFYYASTQVGGINSTGSSTTFNTTSDYRVKENVVEMTGATERLKQLSPKRFNFITDANTTVDGFLAHEVQTIVPEAITGEKDAVDEEGNPVYQGIDQSKLVPLLTASLKEAIAKIEELETRIATLENA